MMKNLIKCLFVIALLVFAVLSVSAEETVIFSDDFSRNSLSEYELAGNWSISGGKLNLGSGSGSAYLYYDIPQQYKNGNYKIEVDFLGHTSTGGILVGGSGAKLDAVPEKFHGFDCFIGGNGKKGALGCYKANGDWSGNIFVSGDVVTATDIHLTVEVHGNSLTYRVSSLDGSTVYYSVNYTIGTADRDVYDAFSGRVGLRKFYADKGSFDNFKVTAGDATQPSGGSAAPADAIVIFSDDFSGNSLDAYELNGNWNITDGKLNLGSGSGSAYLYYDLPQEYKNGGYRIDVDFLGHTSTGGVLVGGSGANLVAAPANFHGFDCFIGGNGKKGAFGCYKADGTWSGNIFVSGDIITASDIHLTVEVYGNSLTYRVTSPDGNNVYYSVSYTIGTSDRDVYDAFSGRIGLRKFYADKGAFDNFKVTVYNGNSGTAYNASTVIPVSAKETVILSDDFSVNSLNNYTLKGDWNIANGKLNLGSGTGSGFLFYDFPAQYKGCNYKVEVDFLGHTSTGGILVGAGAPSLTAVPEDFYGFNGFIGNNGKKGALGCYNASGAWGGNIIVGDDIITASDLHLSMEVYDNELTYRITSLDGKTLYYGVNYTLGTANRDIYNFFDGKIGLRKFYTDKGAFDNFKVTVYGDEQLPALNKKLELNGVAFSASDGLRLENGSVSGSGSMLTETAMADNFKAALTLTPENNTRLLFGMTDEKNGYAFEIDKKNETLAFYRITDGKYARLGVKHLPVYSGEHAAYVEVRDGVATVMFDTFFEKENAFWSFSLKFSNYKTGKFGVMLDGDSVKGLTVTSPAATEKTYTNPVVQGADPDVLYYDGTYYLYNRVHAGNGIFGVSTSKDMVKWTAGDIIFTIDPAVDTATGYMSPNVTYYGGTFYLFYAAKNAEGSNRLYCATSDSPTGPFTHKHGQTPLHEVPEIGGHPYIDDNGKVYLTYARFGNGNHIWIEEVTLANDTATPVAGTLTKLISPNTEFENDGYGHISEGGVITKHNGYYYMIYATGHFQGHYGETYAVSKDILGPYTKYEYGDFLTWNLHTDGVGDAVFVKSPDGAELWLVYHRHQAPGQYTSRYTCIDKAKFVADPLGGPDILTVQGPSTTPQVMPSGGNTRTEVKLTIGSTTAYVNGTAHTLDAAPINRHNRTMLPVRFLANAFGVSDDGIKWDGATRTATLTNSEVTIVVTIDAPAMTVNGRAVALDSPAIIESNRTYLPVRAIANALGVSDDNIAWDAATNTATLTK
ncbi:MAG: family 43 glycosylhydrolase [Clostridia bacterium]|nr:family 43 glycosylhydrolase [Clostridia bacterium]